MPRCFFLLLALTAAALAQPQPPFIDPRDNKTYRAVKIGKQVWMAENLNFEIEGSKCYDNDPANCAKYGRLYNWATANKACPSGWHLPSNAEWDDLINAAGGEETVGKNLKAKSRWIIEDKSDNSTDEFGFAALPGGIGISSAGRFLYAGNDGNWWSSSGHDAYLAYLAYALLMLYSSESVYKIDINKSNLISIRCVQD